MHMPSQTVCVRRADTAGTDVDMPKRSSAPSEPDSAGRVLTDLAKASAGLGVRTIGIGALVTWAPALPPFFARHSAVTGRTGMVDDAASAGRHLDFVRQAFEPFLWTELAVVPDLWGLAADQPHTVLDWLIAAGLADAAGQDGFFIPVHGPGTYCGLVILWGGAGSFRTDQKLRLQAQGTAAHWRLHRLNRRPEERQAKAVGNHGLSARELAVLRCLAGGMTHVQSAAALGITERTVLHHVAQARRKLSARTRVETMTAALRLGLV